MSANGHPPPMPNEWAVASLTVDHHDDPGKQPVFQLKKSITKNGRGSSSP